MKKATKPVQKGSPLPEPRTDDLRGRQSVRATFKLSRECIAALQIVATHLQIKQKSLFDHLMEDTEFLSAAGRELQDQRPSRGNAVQKTFVISRRTLVSLDRISSEFNASRNALIEYSVRRLLPIISEEREKHELHKKLLLKIERHLQEGVDLMKSYQKFLSPEDPVLEKFDLALSTYTNLVQQMRDKIEKGRLIEDFQEESPF